MCDSKELPTFQKICGEAYNFDDALERQNLSMEGIEELRAKLKSREVVPKFLVDSMLLAFLNSCKGNVEKTANKVEIYYQQKHASPEFFANRDVTSPEITQCLDLLAYVGLPLLDNCNLLLHKLRGPSPASSYVFDEAVKTNIMKTEFYAFQQGPRDGTIFINDLENVSFWHIFRPSMSSLRKSLKFLHDASPLDVKAIHIMNTIPLIDKIMALVKPFMRSEMLKKIHFHPANMDYEEFHRKWIPKSHCPADYGGDLPSIDEMHEKQRKAFVEMRDYFILEEQQKNYMYDKYADVYEIKRQELEAQRQERLLEKEKLKNL